MTRADTRIPPHGIIEQNSTAAYLLRFVLVIALVFLIFGASIVLKKPVFPVDDTESEQYIPKIYSKLEGIDPEERDLFHGFRTSFLPAEEVMLAKRHSQRNLEIDNEPSDSFIWGLSDEERPPSRPKRMSSFLFTSEDDKSREENSPSRHHGIEERDQDSTDESDEDYDSEETNSQQENEGIKSIVRPTVDRGPLDDVVEQIRGQPELEEGEIESAAHLYKPAPRHTGTHAFWKGQGDKTNIRDTQASIMKRNMDFTADPCQDFYQYACGNWAALNPIPADKAGYDTFEMLRENLDVVLKELLEFHEFNQPFRSSYPGAHLDMNYFSLNNNQQQWEQKTSELYLEAIKANNRDFFNNTNEGRYIYHWTNRDDDKSEIINHIHSLVKRRTRPIVKASNVTKSKGIPHAKIKRTNNLRKSDVIELLHDRRKKLKPILTASDTDKRNLRESNIIKLLLNRRKKRSLERIIQTKPIVRRKLQISPVRKSRYKRLTDGAKHPDDLSEGDATLKAKFLFVSCMNYKILQKRGHQPLLDLLDLLGGWPILDKKWTPKAFDWLELMVKLRLYNNDILISEWVGPDIKNSDEYVIQFDQTSLGLPTRDYFLQDSNKVYLNAYKDYLIKIANLLGGEKEHVLHSANELINFEIKLAGITSAPEDRRNVSELYQRMTVHKLEKMVPEIKWRRYLCGVMNRNVQSNESVVLFALTYVRHLVKLINKTEPRVMANYLLWRFVRHRVNNLDDRFQSAKQQFYFILFGREQSPPRWKNCVSQVNSNMGMALGAMFVKKHFDETSKNDTLTMTTELQQSFIELLQKIDWIDDGTKKLAAQKVDKMMLRIGYPDFILSKKELDERYKDVIIHPDKYFENILNILQHLTETEQARIGQPVNKTLWNTAPAVVNAYYSRNKNQIMFPAGILQPPFYHRHFPKSLNYGGIGVVIGHEITHGFDDKGRLFDCNGNLHRWWSDTAIEAFHQHAQCLIDQYGRYVVPEVNMKLDGVNTQGENIADNGGVKQAFRAYTHWVEKHGIEDETLPGLNHTHTQLFFLNFAQVWCGAMRSEAMRNKLKTAVHSPGRFRVIGTLSNSFDFAREFQCPAGSPMNPREKCSVW